MKSDYILYLTSENSSLNKQDDQGSIFGENPVLLYQKIVVWLEEEFSKLERIRDKESEYYQKQYQPNSSPSNSNEIENNQVSSIFTSRNVISNCLANEFPKNKPQVVKRGNNKKCKMFNCTICGEKFPNGQALGKQFD